MVNLIGRNYRHKRVFTWVIMSLAAGFPLLFMDGHINEVFAQEEKRPEKEDSTWDVLNLYGRVVGSVDTEGNVSNLYGRSVGSVDDTGIVFNVSKIVIGKIEPDGTVLNQIGTVLGAVEADGDVFNRSGRKIGSVQAEEKLIHIGGAARLLLL